jgi:hypothetical protein
LVNAALQIQPERDAQCFDVYLRNIYKSDIWRCKMAKSKKILVLFGLFLISVSLYAENRTGKVVAIENATTLGNVVKYVYIDNNNDGIIDSILYIYGENRDVGTIVVGYIKMGSAVVNSFSATKVASGVFWGGIEDIISIDGITINRMTARKLFN